MNEDVDIRDSPVLSLMLKNYITNIRIKSHYHYIGNGVSIQDLPLSK